jgi:hypothetical protein
MLVVGEVMVTIGCWLEEINQEIFSCNSHCVRYRVFQ